MYILCFFFFFLFQLCCLLRFQNSPQTHLWEGFLLCGNFSFFTTPFSGQVSIPTSFVSHFVFCIMSYILSKRMGCLSGCLVSSASVQKLFCGSCSAFKWLLMNLWGSNCLFLLILSLKFIVFVLDFSRHSVVCELMLMFPRLYFGIPSRLPLPPNSRKSLEIPIFTLKLSVLGPFRLI